MEMAKEAATKVRKARAKVPVNETKADKFKRLGNMRMNKALTTIRLLGNLSSRGSYEYGEEQIANMQKALDMAVTETMQRFRTAPKSGEDKPGFSF
jgi:CBS domain containing-hemolysin-like protein